MPDSRPVLVTGGTGTLGRTVVRTLLDRGTPVRVLSRGGRSPLAPDAAEWAVGDLVTGEGLAEALAGVGTVVHAATNAARPSRDLDAAANLLLGSRLAGTEHLLDVSIVGIDTVPLGYYRVKRHVEDLVDAGGVPWTILRSTQFHQLVASLLRVLTAPPVAVVPEGVRVQPVDVRDVAARIAELVTAGPSGRADEIGGPEVLDLADAARVYLTATGRRRRLWVAPFPGGTMAGLRAGGNLTPAHAVAGGRTFARHVAVAAGR